MLVFMTFIIFVAIPLHYQGNDIHIILFSTFYRIIIKTDVNSTNSAIKYDGYA